VQKALDLYTSDGAITAAQMIENYEENVKKTQAGTGTAFKPSYSMSLTDVSTQAKAYALRDSIKLYAGATLPDPGSSSVVTPASSSSAKSSSSVASSSSAKSSSSVAPASSSSAKSSSSVAKSSSSQGQAVSGTATLTKHGSGGTTQTVAAGESIADFYFTIAGATGATVTGLPDGVTGTLKGSDFYISGTVGSNVAPGAYSFTVTTTGATTNASKSGTITVVASGTAPASSSSASKDPEPAEGSSSSMELPNSSESGTTILSQVAGVRANLSVEGRTVVVHGISQNTAPIYLFDQQGRLVAKSLASENCAIAVPRAGTYLVRIGHETHRIIVR